MTVLPNAFDAGCDMSQPSLFTSDKLQQDGTKVQPRFYSQANPLVRAAGGVDVYAVGALHEVYQQCFSKLRAKKRKKYMQTLFQTLHHVFCIYINCWIYTESRLSEYIHLIIKLPEWHGQISTKQFRSLPELAESSRREYVWSDEDHDPHHHHQLLFSLWKHIISPKTRRRRRRRRNKYIYNNLLTLKCSFVLFLVRRPACWRWSWALWGWAWRRRFRWSCCCSPPGCGPPGPAGNSGWPHSGWSRGARWGCFGRAAKGHFMLHVAPDADDRNMKTKQAKRMTSLLSALSVCHTGIPNVWLRRQVSFLFAEKKKHFWSSDNPPKILSEF